MNQLIISAATEGANPLVPNPWEMLVVFAGFAVLMFIVVKYVVPMFEKTFASLKNHPPPERRIKKWAQVSASSGCLTLSHLWPAP